MTASEILNIAVTVGLCQLVADWLANLMVFNKEPYKRACSAMERSKWKVVKAEEDYKKNNAKFEKRLQRARDEYGDACSDVARRHMAPSLWTSLFFVMLLRILGAEHQGNVMAVLPFQPWKFVARVTARGLSWTDEQILTLASQQEIIAPSNPKLHIHHHQGTSFLLIYFLCTLSVKYFVNRVFGTRPPEGADNGLMTMMESPAAQRLMRQAGFDPDLLKPE